MKSEAMVDRQGVAVEGKPGMYFCIECGCVDVEGTAWIHLNSSQITGDDPPTEGYWCPGCEGHARRIGIFQEVGGEVPQFELWAWPSPAAVST